MPKSLPIHPEDVRARGVLHSPEIPLNAYEANPGAEAALYGRDGLLRMYRDMLILREFETMLDRIKKEGAWEGIAYNHRGPAHLSIGQESAAVGQAYWLTPDDLIFGSHRSHGEILAKSLSAIHKLGVDELGRIMSGYFDGRILRAVEEFSDASDKNLAIDFTLYGTLAEIFAKGNGFNRGLGGSMHAFFPPFGIMPNNAIVGGSADIAMGAALFKRVQRRPGIVIANIGDASLGCGPVWEAMHFAAMDQFHTLWEREIGGHPPILFNFMNNFYGMGGQPKGETMGVDVLARAGLGVNPQAMHAERVDGLNPLAVADAIARKRRTLESGAGPVRLGHVEAKVAVRARHARTGGSHPRHDYRVMGEDDVRSVFAEPPAEIGGGDLGHDEWGHGADLGMVALVGGERAFPAMLEPLVLLALDDEAGPVVAQRLQSAEGGHQRAVMIGAHRVQGGVVDDVVAVNPGVAGPVEFGKIRWRPRWQEHDALNPPRLEDGVEPLERDAFATDKKGLELETQFECALTGAGGEGGVEFAAGGGASGFVEIDGRDDAAKDLVPRAAHLGHDRAHERIGFVADRIGGGANAGGRRGVDAGVAPECL